MQFEDEYGNPDMDKAANRYIELFKENGFEICNDINLETGFEKIAIYATEAFVFTHVSLQLENGTWTSKMGDFEDIEHTDLFTLSGNDKGYGQPKYFMKRQRT